MSDIEKEMTEHTEEVIENKGENEESVVQESTEVLAPEVDKKVKKHLVAKKLVAEAKSMIEENESELNECKLILDNDLQAYADAKRTLHTGGLDDAKALLVELGFSTVSDLDKEEENLVFEPNDEIPAVRIKDVHSGKFTGFILSLLAGTVTFGGLVYWATEKLDMTLNLSNVAQKGTLDTIGNYFSNLVGAGDNAMLGMGLVGAASILSMIVVYVLRVEMKGNRNLKFANMQMKETQKYITHKSNCKLEMDRVDRHISDAITTLKDYEVLLTEQNGKLKRIVHFEGAQENELGYSQHAKDEMKVTQNLIETIQHFVEEPMSHQGKLSEETVVLLDKAKEEVKKLVSKWI